MNGPQVNQVGHSAGNPLQVDLASLLAGWIEAIEQDSARRRSAVYELARLQLQRAGFLLDPPVSRADARRVMLALEAAIVRVEAQALKRDELRFARLYHQLAAEVEPQSQRQALLAPVRVVEPEVEILEGAPRRIRILRSAPERSRVRIWSSAARRVAIAALALVAVAVFMSALRPIVRSIPPVYQADLMPDSAVPARLADPASSPTVEISSPLASLPLPSIYGVYALSNGQLHELESLPGKVPDPRVFMSTAINMPSHTILPDGRVEFIVYRRDIAASAPDKIAVRAVAKIPRAITFNAAGKPGTALVEDAWTIRNISYGFNVAPVGDNSELIRVRPEDPDFVFPAGRYALVLKSVAYDFTVAGSIIAPAQCLERVSAANGTFYAECKRP